MQPSCISMRKACRNRTVCLPVIHACTQARGKAAPCSVRKSISKLLTYIQQYNKTQFYFFFFSPLNTGLYFKPISLASNNRHKTQTVDDICFWRCTGKKVEVLMFAFNKQVSAPGHSRLTCQQSPHQEVFHSISHQHQHQGAFMSRDKIHLFSAHSHQTSHTMGLIYFNVNKCFDPNLVKLNSAFNPLNQPQLAFLRWMMNFYRQ